MKKITVLLADDNRDVRRKFRELLEFDCDFEIVGEARNEQKAVSMVKKFCPAFVLMDISMPPLNGFHATREILKDSPATKVLMLSAHSEDAYVEEAMNSGAMGYLVKQTCVDSLCSAIREVQKGNTFFSPSIPGRIPNGIRDWINGSPYPSPNQPTLKSQNSNI